MRQNSSRGEALESLSYVIVERPHHITSDLADTYVATRLCISGVNLEVIG